LHRAADNGLALVDDLLGLAKASGTPRPEALDVARVIDVASEGIDNVHVSFDGVVPVVVADRVGLTQAIRNLVSNSSRYGHNGGSANVVVRTEDDSGGWFVTVSDDGPGLSPVDAERIFEPFYRGADRSVGGTGLGLAIVASFVESHGGRVWVDTTVNHGARFVMYLPKRTAEPAPHDAAAKKD
jgi:signal transduction histidine kinase